MFQQNPKAKTKDQIQRAYSWYAERMKTDAKSTLPAKETNPMTTLAIEKHQEISKLRALLRRRTMAFSGSSQIFKTKWIFFGPEGQTNALRLSNNYGNAIHWLKKQPNCPKGTLRDSRSGGPHVI